MDETAIIETLPHWEDTDLALVCGIANAGGGTILVLSGDRRGRTDSRRFRKVFETIPTLCARELGLACGTEPAIDGANLCLAINVPGAADPVKFRNKCYLYSNGSNKAIEPEHLEMIRTTSASAAGDDSHDTTGVDAAQVADVAAENEKPKARKPSASSAGQPSNKKRPTFKERSVAAANRLDMTSTDEYVLKVIETNGRVTAVRIAEVLGVSESTVRRSFRRLREYGFIERIGSDKAGYWRLTD